MRVKQTPALGSDQSPEHTHANNFNQRSAGSGSASSHPCPICPIPLKEQHGSFPHITGAFTEVETRLRCKAGLGPICPTMRAPQAVLGLAVLYGRPRHTYQYMPPKVSAEYIGK